MTLAAETPVVKKTERAPTRTGWLMRQPRAVASMCFLLFLAFIALSAPWLAPYDPTKPDFGALLQGPSAAHWLGTDDLGRDILSRLMHGAGPSLVSAFASVALGMAIGVPVGLLAGFLGGWTDTVISRVLDALLSFPTILFAVGIAGILGPSMTTGLIALGVLFSPQFARLVRARTLVVRQELYVDAARAFGASTSRILIRHVLPNAIQSAIVHAGLLLAIALLAESSLSFLGFGVQPPHTSWGAMLARAYAYMESAPYLMFPPGIAILLTALSFNGLGETTRVLLDPQSPKA
ncbi:diguanylate cyclase [Oceanicola sp. 22II-s10i]|uniref:ABC transporter permease n=1 Tax=Oceanicola sp. 22II-s10i TaxID=1317116 RepID=UPI000B524088|nr:ABC transporter permease [Oceanicola sp. 22II-s10i]OWU83499.1 diguanylate cyclase [Oceanicola sp. 22II-s10i]